jgi:hypothetical protein
MGGLDPKYWTRWRYFKEITLHFWWHDAKIVIGFLKTGILILACMPRLLLHEIRRKHADRT